MNNQFKKLWGFHQNLYQVIRKDRASWSGHSRKPYVIVYLKTEKKKQRAPRGPGRSFVGQEKLALSVALVIYRRSPFFTGHRTRVIEIFNYRTINTSKIKFTIWSNLVNLTLLYLVHYLGTDFLDWSLGLTYYKMLIQINNGMITRIKQ